MVQAQDSLFQYAADRTLRPRQANADGVRCDHISRFSQGAERRDVGFPGNRVAVVAIDNMPGKFKY